MEITVKTDKGRVKGVQKAGYREFLGIPYAKPPVGSLRFCAPEPCDPWSGILDASVFGPSAPQLQSAVGGMTPEGPLDEDCLYLNIYTPATDNKLRPVLFWIHGGGFTGGSASTAQYYGGPFVIRGNVVLVTINYRLGALGYLDLSEIGGADRGATANAGQLDQISALRWVQSNIALFGGNPDDVTVFGESAGSMAVATLLTMPGTEGLFKKAICQSGGANNVQSKSQAADLAMIFLEQAGLTHKNIGRLWDFPAKEFVTLQNQVMRQAGQPGGGLRYVPVYGTPSLPDRPLEAIRRGKGRQIPLIVGNNRDEDKLFTRMMAPNPDPIDDAVLIQRVARELPENKKDQAGQLMTTYRLSREKAGLAFGNHDILEAICGDIRFRIPGLALLEAQGRYQLNVFSYLFTWESPARRGALGACHALDLPFVFGTFFQPGQDKFAGTGPEVEKLSANMMDAWIAFAKSGNPSHTEIGTWEPYTQESRRTMIFGREIRLESAPFEEERVILNAILSG